MKQNKILFFFVYLGDCHSNDDDVHKRILIVKEELEYLNNTLSDKDIFDTKYIIPVAPLRYHDLVKSLADKYSLTIYNDNIGDTNLFEYPAYLAMSEYSNSHPNCLFFYGHAKGTGNPNPISYEIYKLNIKMLLIENIEFYFNDNINKVCLFPSQHGWAWHNFFWVKSDYIKTKELSISDNRYYYESFIGDFNNEFGYKECISPWPINYNFNGFNVKDYYNPEDLSKMGYMFDTKY